MFSCKIFSYKSSFDDCNETITDWTTKFGTLLVSGGPRMRAKRRPSGDDTDVAATSTCSKYFLNRMRRSFNRRAPVAVCLGTGSSGTNRCGQSFPACMQGLSPVRATVWALHAKNACLSVFRINPNPNPKRPSFSHDFVNSSATVDTLTYLETHFQAVHFVFLHLFYISYCAKVTSW